MTYEFKGFDCQNCGLITEEQTRETKDPNNDTGYACLKCEDVAFPQFKGEEGEESGPGFPYLAFCPDAIYAADTHNPETCKHCQSLSKTTASCTQ